MKIRMDNVLQFDRETFNRFKGSDEIQVVPMEGHGKVSIRIGDKFYDIEVPQSGVLTWDEVRRQISALEKQD